MTGRQQWITVGAIVAVMAIALGAASYFMRDQLFPVTVGAQAPDFKANVLGTKQIKTMADYKGQVVLLNVWATWCGPCKEEIPSLEKLYKEYGPNGLKLVAVSIDDYVSEDSIRAFAKNFGVTFEVLHDSTHAIERTYQTTGYPETFIIARDGTIRRKLIGAADWSSDANRALIRELLGVSAGSAAAPSNTGSGSDAPDSVTLSGPAKPAR